MTIEEGTKKEEKPIFESSGSAYQTLVKRIKLANHDTTPVEKIKEITNKSSGLNNILHQIDEE